MTTWIILVLLYCIVTTAVTSTIPTSHSCSVESYTESVTIRDCLNTSIDIETTRCRGYCYSDDILIYDWQYEPTHYRHKHHLNCCSPNRTIPHKIQITCNNKQQRTIKYHIVTRCECKLCADNCEG